MQNINLPFVEIKQSETLLFCVLCIMVHLQMHLLLDFSAQIQRSTSSSTIWQGIKKPIVCCNHKQLFNSSEHTHFEQ